MMRTKTFFIGFTFLLLAAMSVFFLPGVFLTHAQMAASAGTLGSQLILPVQGGTLAVSGALDKSSYAPGETITATVTIEWKVSGGASVALGALAAVDPPTPPLSLPGRSDTSEFAGFFIPKVRSVFTPPGSGDPSPAKVAIKEPVARSTTVTKSVQFTAPSGVGAHKIVGWGGYVLNAGGTFGSGFIDYGDYFTLPFIVEMRSSSPPPPTGGGIVCQPAAGSESGGFKGNLPLEGSAQTAPLQTGQVFTLECWNTVDPAGTKVRESVTALVPPPAFGALDLFSLTNSGDITVMQGGVSSNTIAVVKGKDEYKGLVYLSTTTDLKIEKAEVSLAPPSARAGTTSTFSV
ncbi:MAG: hypothetical protein HYZ07_00095, partial [Candidatus Harrisonbacteria bacterium]|nr:hypothetical protein [Candidatus Harrisonbacteria bacterium]